jgi:hypothetical protein
MYPSSQKLSRFEIINDESSNLTHYTDLRNEVNVTRNSGAFLCQCPCKPVDPKLFYFFSDSDPASALISDPNPASNPNAFKKDIRLVLICPKSLRSSKFGI